MPTIKFITKGNKDPQTLYLRLRDGRKTDYTLSTGITISPKHWSKTKNWISPKSDFHNKPKIEKTLRTLESIVLNERNTRLGNGHPITKDWLLDIIVKWQGKKSDGINDYLTDLIKSYKEVLPQRVRNGKLGVSSGTIRNYNTTISRLLKFEKFKKTKLRAIEIDFKFHEHYLKFAGDRLKLSQNSIGKDIKNIKAVCSDAKDRGIQVHENVLSRKFNAPSEKSQFVVLNETELDMIREFHGADYLENARDWLLIGCWTGCRFGDLMKLNMKNILPHKSGTKIIQYTQSKTGKLVSLPIHPHVKDIIERLNGFPRSISNVKFNKYIKEVCRHSKLTYQESGTRQNPNTHLKELGSFEKWTLVKSHTCRRSFATNHYNKMNNKQIMAVTGHATERMLLDYIGKADVEHISDFVNLWESTDTSIRKMKKA